MKILLKKVFIYVIIVQVLKCGIKNIAPTKTKYEKRKRS